jgi:hypothetical protein
MVSFFLLQGGNSKCNDSSYWHFCCCAYKSTLHTSLLMDSAPFFPLQEPFLTTAPVVPRRLKSYGSVRYRQGREWMHPYDRLACCCVVHAVSQKDKKECKKAIGEGRRLFGALTCGRPCAIESIKGVMSFRRVGRTATTTNCSNALRTAGRRTMRINMRRGTQGSKSIPCWVMQDQMQHQGMSGVCESPRMHRCRGRSRRR